jgi:Cytochrome c7 and related cytochrome c
LAQIFPQSANKIPLLVAAVALVLPAVAVAFVWYYFSPSFTDVGYQPVQPVPYSHKLHAGEMQIDCRYCHASVETSPIANVPPTQACMNCHLLVSRNVESLAPIRDSAKNGTPMKWLRVHKLGEYAYFNHRVHVRSGVGCVSCHGHVEEMEVVRQVEPLSMSWCLDCHRNPTPHLRPLSEITNMAWKPARDPEARARQIAALRPVKPPVDCSGCHR